MKKLIALTLALMLVLASAALAEPANILKLSDMVLSVTTDGQEQVMDLQGLNAQFAIGAAEGVPTIEVDADDGSQALLCGVMQIVDGKLVMDVEGMERPIAATIQAPSIAGMGVDPAEALSEMFANAGTASDAKLPIFQGTEIPKIDLMAITNVLPMIGVEPVIDGQNASFSIPYALVKQLLTMVSSMVPAEVAGQLGSVLEGINSMVESDNGFALEGKVSDDGETSELLIDLYMVNGGVTTEAPVGGLYIASTLNAVTVQVLLYQDGQSYPVAVINLTSDPEAPTLAFSADLMGSVSINFSLYPDEINENCQVAALEFTGNGQTVTASVNYGETGDMEFCDLSADFAGQSTFGIHIDETPAADGSKEGTLVIFVQNSATSQDVQFSANIQEVNEEFSFRSIDNVADAYDAEAMTAEEQAAFNQDLAIAMAPLLQYISDVTAQPAA